MGEMHVVPIRGKPRTLEKTMMNVGFVDGGGGRRAMGAGMDFTEFYTAGLECTQ